MKKFILGLVLISLLVLPALSLVQAQVTDVLPDKTAGDVMNAFGIVTNYLYTILLALAAIFIMLAGFTFVTAAGDPEKVKTARSYVVYSILGVLVAFLAKGLVDLAKTLGGSS